MMNPASACFWKTFSPETMRSFANTMVLEALNWLEGNLPDLIICDIQMPNLDGYKFLEILRQRGYTKHTPVIMLSGTESSKERVRCYRLGAQDFLAKPFNPEELEELIKKNLFPIHFADKW